MSKASLDATDTVAGMTTVSRKGTSAPVIDIPCLGCGAGHDKRHGVQSIAAFCRDFRNNPISRLPGIEACNRTPRGPLDERTDERPQLAAAKLTWAIHRQNSDGLDSVHSSCAGVTGIGNRAIGSPPGAHQRPPLQVGAANAPTLVPTTGLGSAKVRRSPGAEPLDVGRDAYAGH